MLFKSELVKTRQKRSEQRSNVFQTLSSVRGSREVFTFALDIAILSDTEISYPVLE